MPAYGVVDNFNQTVTTDAAQVTPGNTQNVVLSGVTGLPTDGKAILSVFRLRQGREPEPIEQLRDWSGISGTTLTGATRVTGAALAEGDVVTIGFNSLLWATLASGGSFASPTFTGTVTADGATFALDGATLGTSGDEFDVVGTVDFSGATVVGLSAGFDIIVTTAAELVAAMVSGNAGARVWVKGGTYSMTSAHLVIQTGMHILFGGGGTGPVTLDFGDTAYYLRSHTDFRFTLGAGTSGATATISGGIGTDPDGGGSGVLPNEAGWRAFINGNEADYTYASATTFTMSPTPLSDVPNTANGYGVLLTKGAAENVHLSGHLIVKGTSGSGLGTRTFGVQLVGNRWDCSGLALELRKRGYSPSSNSYDHLIHLVNSRMGAVWVTADVAFTNAATAITSNQFLRLRGQNLYIAMLALTKLRNINNSGTALTQRVLQDEHVSHVTIAHLLATAIESGGTGTVTMGGLLSSTPRLCCRILGGGGSAWRNGGAALTWGADSGAISGFSTTNGSSLGTWTYTP